MTIFDDESSARARRRLVALLQETGVARSPRVLDAFATIPRELFVPAFYKDLGRSWQWCRREDVSEEQWLAEVYQDDALVTKISAANLPICSSSMPSLMARMLEALDVQPGQHVLEIGTGTGYNAALLSYLTGDPLFVVTMEIDEAIASQAEQVLHRVVGSVQVMVGDGVHDVALACSPDRIVATASASSISRRWYEGLGR